MNWHTGPMKDVRHNGESTETKQQEATMTSNDRISVTRREAVKSAAVGAVAAGLGESQGTAISRGSDRLPVLSRRSSCGAGWNIRRGSVSARLAILSRSTECAG